MIKAILFDFSRTLLFPVDKSYRGSLNSLYNEVYQKEDFDFFDYFEINTELIDFISSKKNKIGLFIFTTSLIQNDPDVRFKLEEVFQKIFSSKEIGLSKTDKKSYEYISNDIGIDTSEILFIDDNQDNLNIAKTAGLTTAIYENNQEIVKLINNLGI